MIKYSFTKGLKKTGTQVLIWGLSLLGVVLLSNNSELYNTSIVELFSNNLKEIIGSVTLGGAITIIVNWLKVKYQK